MIKKYTICNSLDCVNTNLSKINTLLINDGLDIITQQKVTGFVDEGSELVQTNKWFYKNPDEKYLEKVNLHKQTDIHPNSEEIIYYKIYKFINDDNKIINTDWTLPPHSLDYKLGLNIKLQSDLKFDSFGNLTECIYYQKTERDERNNIIYLDPIVKYNAEYHYDNDGYCTHRIISRDWILSNNEWSGILKESRKEYTRIQSRDIGIRRRKSVISNVILNVGGLVLYTEPTVTTIKEAEEFALQLIIDTSNEISAYYEYGTKKYNNEPFPLQYKISISEIPWLNNELTGIVPGFENKTIRDFILYSISQSPV